MKKALSIILAAILAATLGGCSTGTSPTPMPTATPSPSSSAQKTSINGLNSDMYKSDTVMFKADGVPVYWPEYLYRVASVISYIYNTVGYYPTDWSASIADKQTVRDYVLSSATSAVAMYRAVEKKAAEIGIKLDEDDQAEINADIQSGITYYETREAFDNYLKSTYLTEDMFRYMEGVSILYKKLFESIYGENANKYSDGDTLAYAQKEGYIKVKHIFMASSTDTAKDSETKAKMQSILDQLKAAGSDEKRNALFDQLMRSSSQDTGLAKYPDGYVFKSGDMDDAFQSASEALSIGGMSEIVKSSYGYHIILRLPLDSDDAVFSSNSSGSDNGAAFNLRYYAAYSEFQTIVAGWTQAVKIEPTDALNNMDLSKIYK